MFVMCAKINNNLRFNCKGGALTMLLILTIILSVSRTECAKILAVFPTPSISHQVVFRPLTQELAKRGHELVIVTPNPAFPKGGAPENILEIDVQNASYAVKDALTSHVHKNNLSLISKSILLGQLFARVFDVQLKNREFDNVLKLDEDYFDLLLIEACATATLGLSHVFKAPVIQVSSLGSLLTNHLALGIPTHPFLYPTSIRNRIYNLTLMEKFKALVELCVTKYIMTLTRRLENEVLRENFGPEIPSLDELTNNIDMLFLNTHPIWSGNYPVPPNVVFIRGIHQRPLKELPKDLKSWLDSSKNGVIYVSFGSNVDKEIFTQKTKEILKNVLNNLPYDVLLKWDDDQLMPQTKSIKISNWFPQADLLHHPNIKLFITQGGLQSTDEAITAGVPLIGMPVFVDQAYNVEKYEHFKIGIKLEIAKLTEQKLRETIDMVIGDNDYRRNIVNLNKLLNDETQSPLDRAVWWCEYVLRNGGARHLRSPAANIPWTEYFEIELVAIVTAIIFSLITVMIVIVKYFLKILFTKVKVKTN